jgi:hypothetical protein
MAELGSLRKMSQGGRVLPFNTALFYLGVGDHGRALDNLERALAANSQMMAWDRTGRHLRPAPLGAAVQGVDEESEFQVTGGWHSPSRR